MSLSGAEIRQKFIHYFKEKRGHLHLPSASLIPDNPTLLLTSAGMVPFVPYFLGQAVPPATRIVTCQKSARAGGKDSDIENIGRTARHHSFFEMLGNFSFGDYFKKEVIPWAFEWVTEDLGLDAERITATVFEGDDQVSADEEAYEIWHKQVGLPKERIIRMSRSDNFWGPPGPTGPCGPCSELYYDRGPDLKNPEEADARGDRHVEIWNLVFMELFKDEAGKYSPLAAKNVDTGAGLERLATVLQKKQNSFETDLLFPILQEVSKLSGIKYGANEKSDVFLKIITDHARCVNFLLADGIRTSNVGRGYVLRFITRRAARFGRLLGINEPFLYKMVPVVAEIYGSAYPEIVQQADLLQSLLRTEEERFAKTIDRGMTYLNELLERGDKVVPGGEAFNLYATYGFPIELTCEIAEEKGVSIDMDGFAMARQEHEEVSSGDKFKVILTGEEILGDILKKHGATVFCGYEALFEKAVVLAIVSGGKALEHADEGAEVDVILDQTPFYAESGGQVGDRGIIENEAVRLLVLDVRKHEGLHIHKVRVLAGTLETGQQLTASVDRDFRNQTMLHHSSAHLFHSAIREILGKQVTQAGQQVNPDTMRFDFAFDRQMSAGEIMAVENLINEWVRASYAVTTQELPVDEAKQTGAIAMFGEKYGDVVRVVGMGDVSLEFCGGIHVANTGEIGPVKIISEGSIASGVRRVEALSGPKAWSYISNSMNVLNAAAARLKIKPGDLLSQIERLQEQLKAREKAAQMLEEKLAVSQVPALLAGAEFIDDIKLVAAQVNDISAESLKTVADALRRKEDKVVAILAAKQDDGKVAFAVGVSDYLTKNGLNAGKIVKEVAGVCGGGGGGRPELAQAGGKHAEKLAEALKAGKHMVLDLSGAKA